MKIINLKSQLRSQCVPFMLLIKAMFSIKFSVKGSNSVGSRKADDLEFQASFLHKLNGLSFKELDLL